MMRTGAATKGVPMSNLKDKVAIVTGASKGIGAAIAKRLSEAGGAVVVNYSSGKEDADRVVGNIKANGGRAIAAKAMSPRPLTYSGCLRRQKRPSIGSIYKFLPLEDITEDEFHREFNINVLGTLLATKEAVKYFGPNRLRLNSSRSSGCSQIHERYGLRKSNSSGRQHLPDLLG
jgi:3-oxoacyl-[acyl-carrier protein] reductase